MPDKISINVDDFTIGELQEFEELTGTTIAQVDWDNCSAGQLVALVFISERKTNPDYTMEDAKQVRITQLKPGSNGKRPTKGSS